MKRRTLLASALVSSHVVVSGCLDRLADDDGDSESTTITDVEFETGVDVDGSSDDEPTVTHDDGTIRVMGVYTIEERCYDPYLADPMYFEDEDLLLISPSQRHNGREECTDAVETVPYRVTVPMTDRVPGTVQVNENWGGIRTVGI